MFIKNVAGPEFESYVKCMERSDHDFCHDYLSCDFSWLSSPNSVGIPTELPIAAKNKRHIRPSLMPLLQRSDVNRRAMQ
jgi:hypothetical protein